MDLVGQKLQPREGQMLKVMEAEEQHRKNENLDFADDSTLLRWYLSRANLNRLSHFLLHLMAHLEFAP